MYHTVYLFCIIDGHTHSLLYKALQKHSKEMGARFYTPYIEKSLEENEYFSEEDYSLYKCDLFKDWGLTIFLRYKKIKVIKKHDKNQMYFLSSATAESYEFNYHAIEIRLNPRRLIKKDDYVTVTYYNDYKEIKNAFKNIFKPVKDTYLSFDDSEYLPFYFDDISKYKVGRIDLCVNIKNTIAKKYMDLIRKADKPKEFFVVEAYYKISKRSKPHSHAYYIECFA